MSEIRCKTGRFSHKLIVSLSLFVMSLAKAQDSVVYDFNIPSQGIDSALNALAEETSAMLLFPYETVQLEKSSAVIGRCSLKDALSVMLRGTNIQASLTEGGVITISQSRNGNKINKFSKLSKTVVNDGALPTCGVDSLAGQIRLLEQAIQPELTLEKIEDSNRIDEVLVTGSYIKRKSYYEAGSPINVLARSDLDSDAPTGRLVDILRFLPSNSGTGAGIVPGGDGGPQEGRLGGGTVDIRGLGGNATLVLLNGQRSTAFPLSDDGRVDVNSLVPGIF